MNKIMVVDDEVIINMQLQERLVSMKYDVVGSASSGEEAVDMAGRVKPDIILMDIVMPGKIDGIDASEIIKKELGIPVIFLTAYADDNFIKRAKNVQPFGYILKPFQEDQIKAAIEIGLYKKDMERRLRESEEKYRFLINNCNHAIFVFQDDSIKIFNPCAKKMLGYSEDELLNLRFIDFINSEDRNVVLERQDETFEGVKSQDVYSFRVSNKDGEELWVEGNSVTVKWEGRPATLIIIRDKTELKKIEEQLQQAQRVDAIGALAGGIAHDFNNILAAIIGYTEIALYHELPGGSSPQHSIEQILKASHRAKNLVQQILAFSRHKEREIKYSKMTPIIKEAIKFLRATLPTTIEIRQKITAKSDIVLCDPGQIHQVLMNLCTNAGHAMRRKGGILEISLQNVKIADCPLEIVEAEKLKAKNLKSKIALDPVFCLKLSVRDTGQGMERFVLERIYEPYYTTKKVGEGTGLGLSVVHGIVKSFGGMINVESEPGKGSAFSIFMPTIENEVKSEKELSESVPFGNEHILFVDDEEVLVDIGKSMLESQGYKVTTKTSSIEALDTFRSKPGEYDLVITDMTMPKMTGDELARELMKIRPDVPIILCTGFCEFITEEKAKSMGIQGFVMKPMVIHEITREIRRAFNGNENVKDTDY